MNIKFLLIAIATVAVTSCSTAYKSGQTPDDVYYSPARAIEENSYRNEVDYRTDNYEDRAIRMQVIDRRWRYLDMDYDYRYDPYRYGYNYGYYYNPYYYNRPIYLPGSLIVNPKNNTPRMTSLGSYNNTRLVSSDAKSGHTRWVNSREYINNSNDSRNNNNFNRRVLTPVFNNSNNSSGNNNSNNSRSNSSENNTRTYNPSSNSSNNSSSSGSSGSSNSGGGVSRPNRGN